MIQNNDCQAVTKQIYISNCAWFDQSGCRLCQKDYFFNGESCQIAGNRIIGCEYYNFENHGNTCIQCSEGKISVEGTCVEDTNIDGNCAHFVDFKCDKCSPEYIKRENNLLHEMGSDPTNSLFTISDFFRSQELLFYPPPSLFCVRKNIENCDTYDTDGLCLTCKSGYSLLGQECLIIIDQRIPFCSILLDLTTCLDCESGYFLTPSGSCSPIVFREFCAQYSKNSIESKCLKCIDNYYLSWDDRCLSRLYSRNISECNIYSGDRDTCLECTPGFILSIDQLKCFAQIPNCELYSSSNWKTQSLQCVKCKSGFYFNDDKICTSGNIANCKNYGLYSETCEECEEGYFKYESNNSSVCSKHNSIPACESYDITSRDKCKQHYLNYRELYFRNKCLPINDIPHCVKYSRSDIGKYITLYNESKETSDIFLAGPKDVTFNCEQCDKGFKPSDDKLNCMSISSGDCDKYMDSGCIECKNDKIVSSDGTCKNIHPLQSSFCAHISFSLYSAGCSQCEVNSIHVSTNNMNICIKDSDLSISTSDNCNSYQISSDGTKECASCIPSYSFQKSSKSCLKDEFCASVIKSPFQVFSGTPDSNGNYFSYQTPNLFSRVESLCLDALDTPSSPSNCHVFAHGLKGKLACVQCKPDFVPIYNISPAASSSVTNFVKTTSDGQFSSKISSLQEISNCVPSSSITLISNCDKYFEFETNKYGCLSCKFGYIGTASNTSIINCYDNKSSECDSDFQYKGLTWDPRIRNKLNFSWGKRYYLDNKKKLYSHVINVFKKTQFHS